jgi:hypothetical protein
MFLGAVILVASYTVFTALIMAVVNLAPVFQADVAIHAVTVIVITSEFRSMTGVTIMAVMSLLVIKIYLRPICDILMAQYAVTRIMDRISMRKLREGNIGHFRYILGMTGKTFSYANMIKLVGYPGVHRMTITAFTLEMLRVNKAR